VNSATFFIEGSNAVCSCQKYPAIRTLQQIIDIGQFNSCASDGIFLKSVMLQFSIGGDVIEALAGSSYPKVTL
jgi:hypothetical protein